MAFGVFADRFGYMGVRVESDSMIDWIHSACKDWGYQIRKINYGNQGWPPRTILDKMIREGILGASFGQLSQHFPECLSEEALKINNAIKRLTEKDREILFIIYVVGEKSKLTMRRYSLERTAYYDLVDAVHKRINTALYLVETEHNRQNCRRIPTDEYGKSSA